MENIKDIEQKAFECVKAETLALRNTKVSFTVKQEKECSKKLEQSLQIREKQIKTAIESSCFTYGIDYKTFMNKLFNEMVRK